MKTTNTLKVRKAGPKNWTAESSEAFAHRMAFDFVAQVETVLKERKMNRAELADQLGVSQGAVSQVLNNPQNLTLRTIGKYCNALAIKAAVVAYDDDDIENEKGLVNSSVFRTCWERLGSPRDNWNIQQLATSYAGTGQYLKLQLFCMQRPQIFMAQVDVQLFTATCFSENFWPVSRTPLVPQRACEYANEVSNG